MIDIAKDLDLFGEQKIEFTRRIKDFTDITSKEAEFTKTFQGPASRKNQAVLQNYGLLGVQSDFNPHQGIAAQWSFNSIERFVGRLEVGSVVYKDGKPYSFSFTFYGKQRALSTVFGADRFSDVDWSDYDHALTRQNVIFSWVGALEDGNILYPLIDGRANYFFGDPSQSIEGNLRNENNGILLTDLKPAIRFAELLKNIFRQYDQTLTGDLVDDSESDWSNLFILVNKLSGASDSAEESNSNFCQYNDGITTLITSLGEDVIDSFTLTQDDSNLFVDPTYTASLPGSHILTFFTFIILDPPPFSDPNFGLYRVSVRVNGVEVTSSTANATPDSSTTLSISMVYELTLNTGDEVTFHLVRESITIPFVGTFNGNDCRANQAWFKMVAPVNQLGQTISLNDQMTDTKIVDFISQVVKAWNLILIPDEFDTSKWSIMSLQDYYAEGEVRDWTEDINIDNMTFDKPKVYKEISMSYTKSDAAIQQAFRDATGRDYGSIKINPDIEFGESKLEITHPCTIIPPSIFRIVDSDGLPTGDFSDITIHKSLNIEGKPVKEPLLMFHYNGLQTTSYGYYLQTGISGVNAVFGQLYQYPHISSSRTYPDTTGTSVTLPYSLERDLLNTISEGTAYSRYWEDTLHTQYDPQNRILNNGEMVLPVLDFIGYKLNDEIYLEKTYWRITEIRHDENGKNARVKLIGSRPTEPVNPKTVRQGGRIEFTAEPNGLQKSATGVYLRNGEYFLNLLRAQIQPNVLLYNQVATTINQIVINEINDIGGRLRTWDDEES